MQFTCSCSCGKSQVSVSGEPLLRFRCHCTICQAVYGKPYADIIAVKASQVSTPVDPRLVFKKLGSLPAVNRGVCPDCNKPVVGFLPLLPYFGIAFVPADNFAPDTILPQPAFHTFYDKRTEDVDNSYRKVSGYIASQWAVLHKVLVASFR